MTIDWEIVLGFVDQRQSLLMELVDIFFTEHAEVMPRISSAVEQQHANELRLYAHRMKGCLRYFGETEAYKLAEQMELDGRAGKLDDTPRQLALLQAAIDEMLVEMRAYKQANAKTS